MANCGGLRRDSFAVIVTITDNFVTSTLSNDSKLND